MLGSAHAGDLHTDKYLLQTILTSLTDTYAHLVTETLEHQRSFKRALPLIGKKKKIKKMVCDKIEMVTSYAVYLLEETSREVKTIDLPNDHVQAFSESLVGILDHSKAAQESCKDMDNALHELYEVEKDINTTLDILSKLED